MQNQNNNIRPTPPQADLDFKISSSSPQLGIFSKPPTPPINPTPITTTPPVMQGVQPNTPLGRKAPIATSVDAMRTAAMSPTTNANPNILNQTAHPVATPNPAAINSATPQSNLATTQNNPTTIQNNLTANQNNPATNTQNPNYKVNPSPNTNSTPSPEQPTTNTQTNNNPNTKTPEATNINPSSTQATLLISELRDSTVIMKDGSFRAVIACKPVNFDLMSEGERAAVEYAYQGFLNSLNFNVQILVRSQKVDITPYVGRLSKLRQASDNMLLNMLMDDYIDFVVDIAQYANIMDKSFFIIIPYYVSIDAEKAIQQTRNFFSSLGFGKKKEAKVTRINRDVYEKAIDELKDRANAVMSGLYKIGVHNVRLNTKELGELYYNFNNPDTAIHEPLGDFSKMSQLYIQQKPNPLKNNNGEKSNV